MSKEAVMRGGQALVGRLAPAVASGGEGSRVLRGEPGGVG